MWPAILPTMGGDRAIAGTPGKDAWIGRVAIRHRRRFALHGGLPESCTRKLRLPLSNWRRSWRGEPGRNADRGLSRAGGAVWTGWGRDHSLHRRRCRGFCRPCRDRDAIAKRLAFAAREFRPIAFDVPLRRPLAGVRDQVQPSLAGPFGSGARWSGKWSGKRSRRGRVGPPVGPPIGAPTDRWNAAPCDARPGERKPSGPRRLNHTATPLAWSGKAFPHSASARALALGYPSWRPRSAGMLQLFSQCRIWVHLIRIRSRTQLG